MMSCIMPGLYTLRMWLTGTLPGRKPLMRTRGCTGDLGVEFLLQVGRRNDDIVNAQKTFRTALGELHKM